MATRAIRFLDEAGIIYRAVEYVFEPDTSDLAGHAARAIGVPPDRVFKTLMLEVDHQPICVVVPANRQVSMKRVAKAAQGKSAAMLPIEKAERRTGYRKGGISPFGQRCPSPLYLDSSAMTFDEVAINGGRRGLLVLLSPTSIADVPGARIANLCDIDTGSA